MVPRFKGGEMRKIIDYARKVSLELKDNASTVGTQQTNTWRWRSAMSEGLISCPKR